MDERPEPVFTAADAATVQATIEGALPEGLVLKRVEVNHWGSAIDIFVRQDRTVKRWRMYEGDSVPSIEPW